MIFLPIASLATKPPPIVPSVHTLPPKPTLSPSEPPKTQEAKRETATMTPCKNGKTPTPTCGKYTPGHTLAIIQSDLVNGL